MCRLAFISEPKRINCKRLFQELEKSMGGQGNGLAWSGGIIKGVKTSVEELAKIAKQEDGPILFHSRLATEGGVTDELCHPFKTKFGALAHNGIWFDWEAAFWGLVAQSRMPQGQPSDTWVMAQLVDINGPDVLTFVDDGVWLLLRPDGTCLAVVHRGSLEIARVRGGIIAASKIPAWLKPKAKKKGHVWRVKPGTVVELSKDGYKVVCGKVVQVAAVKNLAPQQIIYYSSYGGRGKGKKQKRGGGAILQNDFGWIDPPASADTGEMVYGECEFCKIPDYLAEDEDEGLMLCPTCIATLNGEI